MRRSSSRAGSGTSSITRAATAPRSRSRVSDQELADGATLGLGDVKFYFWPAALPKNEPPRGSGRTAPTRRDELVFSAKVQTPRGHQLDLRQRVDGGVLRINDTAIELAAMEFGLLQLLVERRRSVTDPELAYVAWHEIADALSFRSVQADSENVRELVHRVRRKLGGVQADDLDREQARRGLSPRRRSRLTAASRRGAPG